MIKSKLKRGKRTAYFIGLNQDNVRRLKHHRPIVISADELGLDADIILAYKKADRDLLQMLPPSAPGFMERVKESVSGLWPFAREERSE